MPKKGPRGDATCAGGKCQKVRPGARRRGTRARWQPCEKALCVCSWTRSMRLCWRLLRSSEPLPLHAPTFSSFPPQTRSVCLVRAASVHGPLPRVLPASSQVSQGGRFLLRAALARPHFNLPVRAHIIVPPGTACRAHALPGRAACPVTTLNRNTAVRPYQNTPTSERSLTDRGL
jgi:hypothetical protein